MDPVVTRSLLSFSTAFVIAVLALYVTKPKSIKKDDKVSKKKVVLVALIISSIAGIVGLFYPRGVHDETPVYIPTYAPVQYTPSMFAPRLIA